MDNFDLRKYLAEGRLFKENYVDPGYGKPFAVEVGYGSYEDENGNAEKLPNSNIEKTYVRFDPQYYNEEWESYDDISDTEDKRYDKIDNLDFWGVWDPDTMKPSNPGHRADEGNEYYEFESDGGKTYYFDTEKEISDFDEIFKIELNIAKDYNK
jgi:hypothetical protein